MMRRLAIVFVFAALAARAEGPGDPAAAFEEEARRLRGLVEALDSQDPGKREDAAAALLAAGGGAIPYVLDAIHRKEAKLHLAVLQKLVQQEAAGLPAELRLNDDDFAAVVKARAGDPKVQKEGRAWLYARFLEACELYRAGKADLALARVNAILTLEPGVDFAGAARQLKIRCEEQQIQNWLVRTTAAAQKPLVQGGQITRFTFSCTNVAAGAVEIWFGPTDQGDVPEVRAQVLQNNAVLHVEVFTSTVEPDGSFSEKKTDIERPLNRYSIPLKPGETLKIADIELDTPIESAHLCILRVRAWMKPHDISGPGAIPKERTLRFEPAEVRVFPGDLQKAMQHPLEDLLRSLDASDLNSAFLYCNLMPEKDRGPAVEAIIRILQNDKANEADRRFARNCLSALTGIAQPTDQAWLDWHRKGGLTASDPEPRK